jgi:hypothetical protein
MEIKISHNFDDVQKRLDGLQADYASKVLARAVNRTMEQGQTEMRRAITSEFNISSSKVREKLFLKRASFKSGRFELQAELVSRDPRGKRRSINVINFAGRQNNLGVTVKIKKGGERKLIRHAFIGNGGRTVFVREGKARLPIKPVQAIDIPQMFTTKRINDRVLSKIIAVFPVVFEREERFALDRFARGGKA